MARVIKIDNSLQKRFSKKTKKKTERELVTYFLIVCEGEKTEPNYFKSFPKKVGKVIYDIEYDGGGISTLKVVEKAIELKNNSKQKFDRVWAVFDRDSFKESSFNSAILKAKAHGIECAWSNEAFELWYLLHFHNRITAMKRTEYQKSIEVAINEKLKSKKNPFKYKKNATNMYSLLEKYGNQELAIKWAKDLALRINGENFATYNPNTLVYKLIEELTGKSEELNSEILKNYSEGE
ncbi:MULTISPECIES: RloB family protein [unclassified Flavobacterium]|uniref:RloB family protein n=1 Tax=unclassified Flavobacterium TaxID=196869 RepID=UPI0012928A7A|nr:MULTISPECIES: RloB family protein [unclassified Flavobacterium]MQP52762.1 RloB domain-containing protein [Flavobacterium sp. LMO9]MQP63036.1 RloB domain-containing protein [Flavobacterium sp. LMO6]